MDGYVAQRRGRFYAVIYEGRDPVTGKERRRWHPAGTDRAEAEHLAAKLAAKEQGRVDAVRGLTFGAYLTSHWLPAKRLHLATSTYRGYERNAQRHILPVLGKIALRRLKYQQIESLYEALLHPTNGRGLAPKTVYEIHLLIRGSLDDALRRGLVTRNVAIVARAPKQRSLQRIEGQSWTDEELRLFLRSAAGHRFFPMLFLTAMTGMRRNEVLGLKWPDIDFKKQRLALNRGLVAVGYEVHQTRGKTKTASQHRPRRHHPRSARRVAGVPGRRVRRSRDHQPRALGVHRRRWRPHPSPRPVPDLRADRPQRAGAAHPIPRPPAHPRKPAHQGGRPREGGQRTTRACQHRPHHPDLPAPPTRRAGRRRSHLPATRPPSSPGRR